MLCARLQRYCDHTKVFADTKPIFGGIDKFVIVLNVKGTGVWRFLKLCIPQVTYSCHKMFREKTVTFDIPDIPCTLNLILGVIRAGTAAWYCALSNFNFYAN